MARNITQEGREIKPLDMYVDKIVRRLTANSKHLDLSVSSVGMMHIMYDKIITSAGIIKYFQLVRVAEYMPNELLTVLRDIEDEFKGVYAGEGISINMALKMEPHKIEWNTREMRVRTNVWERDIEEVQNKSGKTNLVRDDELKKNKQYNWLKKSWMYFKRMCGAGASTPVVQIYIELSTGVSNAQAFQNLKLASIRLLSMAATQGFELKEINGNLWSFYKLFTPISAGNYELEKYTSKFPLTDEYVSSMTSYYPGKLPGTEVLIGFDIDTGKLVYKNFANAGGGAEVMLVAAITGGGKSYLVKSICFNTAMCNYTMVVMDRDNEYIPIAEELNGTVISMSRANGSYYDSTVIPEVTGIKSIDDDLLVNSRHTTEAVFNILADTGNGTGMSPMELSVFNDAYNNLYKIHGIDADNPATWCNSINLSYHKLYKEIVKFKTNDLEYYKDNESAIKSLITKLRIFFEEDGLHSDMFKNPISLTDIYNKINNNAPIIVLSMDIDTSISKADKPTLMKLITSNFLLETILVYNRKHDRFTFEVVEEFQRYFDNDFAKKIVINQVTGGRKKNANVIIVTNNPDELADAMVADPLLKPISGNITSAIVGRINKESSIEPICTNLGLNGCEQEFYRMIRYPEAHQNAFVCKFDKKEAAVIKAVVPPKYVNSPLFVTRTKGKKE